jgi:predicted nucleic acid-binding protein
MIILDTNVISEMTRQNPADAVKDWFDREEDLYMTAITQAEMLYGLERMPKGRRRDELFESLAEIFNEVFAGRILSFDSEAALSFAHVTVGRERMGRPIKQSDAQIAAIARSRGAAVATRNVADFEQCGIKVIDPWTD